MTRADYTHLAIVLDRSGSMAATRNDVVGGLKTLIEEQQKQPGKCTLTLVQFDNMNPCDVMVDMQPIAEVNPNRTDYDPRGGTPLRDAIGRCIVTTGAALAAMPEAERPGMVLVTIITDGEENSSREYSAALIAKMIKEQESKYGWKFNYIGANQDAVVVGSALGFDANNAATYGAEKTAGVFKNLSGKMSSSRERKSAAAMAYNAADRVELAPEEK